MRRMWWLAAAMAVVMACSRDEGGQVPVPAAGQDAETAAATRGFDPASISRGARLYAEHCAQCHGPHAEGHPDWQTPSDGSFAAAPPLDGTGNDWKRTKAELVKVIRNGVRRKDGVDIMPAWKGRLNDRDIDDVMAWFQSLWAPEVYSEWYKANAAAVPPKG